jgi:hypothetical protein
MKKFVSLLICAAFVFIAGSALAADVTGMVEKKGEAIIIKAADGEYTVAGQDLSAMVGKEVKATGEVADDPAKGKVLTVTAAEEVKK